MVSTRHRLNTRAVIFMGDLTQADAPEEWAALRTGLRYLEAARPPVPYCLLQGDHDLGYEYTGEYPFMFRKAAHRRSQVDGGVASAVTAQPHWRACRFIAVACLVPPIAGPGLLRVVAIARR